jgi:ribosomal protein L37E
MCQEWRDNFWTFVSTVGEKPENHTLRRYWRDEPLGPDNWYWKESTSNKDKANYQREWRKNNPERAKHHEMKKRFGITGQDYDNMFEVQKGVCAICGQPEVAKDKDGGPRMMAVDHCHETGKVRGLLCTGCNTALGGFKDSAQLLEAAKNYLLNHVDTA